MLRPLIWRFSYADEDCPNTDAWPYSVGIRWRLRTKWWRHARSGSEDRGPCEGLTAFPKVSSLIGDLGERSADSQAGTGAETQP